MSEQLFKDLELSRARNINPNCQFCKKTKNKTVEMKLEQDNFWYICPDCKRVQAINTNVPLWWAPCTRPMDNGFCNFPLLVRAEQNGESTVCKKCGFEYTIKISGA